MSAKKIFIKDVRTVFRDKVKMASLLVTVLIPLVYGFLYLWAFWDPYGNMKNVPVAVVNEDEGAIYKGKEEKYGEKITEKMLESKVLDWRLVDREEAVVGLNDQKYYAVVFLPKDFSNSIISAATDDPRQAKIQWETHDSTSYIFTTYFKNVMSVLGKSINDEVSKEFTGEVKEKANDMVGELALASKGAGDLSSGLQEIDDGSKVLNENIQKAAVGSNDLKNGLSSLSSNYQKIDDGIAAGQNGASLLQSGLGTASSGAVQLNEGLADLNNGATKLKDGTEKASDGSEKLSDGTSEMYQRVYTLDQTFLPFTKMLKNVGIKLDEKERLPIVSDTIFNALDKKDQFVDGQKQISEGSKKLSDSLDQIDDGMGSLSNGVSSAKNGSDNLNNGIDKLYTGSSELSGGLTELKDGSSKFSSGLFIAYEGSTNLTSGLEKLANGSDQLSKGIGQATNGAKTLSDKLNSGVEEIEDQISEDKIEKLMVIVGQPIVMENISTNSNTTYGAGFAPYFIPLALWMGALIAGLIFSSKESRLNMLGVSAWEITFGKFGLLAVIGGLQAIMLLMSLIFGLGMSVKYLFWTLVFCVLISWCFMSIMSFLSFKLGKVGELVGIVILVLQLTSSSGTFPVLSSPNFFQFFNYVLPMPYAVRGLRLLILGGNMEIVMRQFAILIIFLSVFLLLKKIMTKKTIAVSDIYPLIEL